MKTRRVSSQLTVRDTDPLVREHRVNHIHILPGVAMLDPVYRTLGAAGWAPESIVLRDVLFHEPVVTHAGMDRRLTVSLVLHADGGDVSVSSVPCRDEQIVSDERTLHLSGMLARADAQAALPPLAAEAAAAAAVDMDTAYAVARHIGIHHDPFMKCLGTVTPLPQGRLRAGVALGEAAAARSDDFLLHPVFLDCATIVALAGLGDRHAEASLFIPFSIGEFRAVSLRGQRRVQVEVGASELGRSDQEILRYTTALFDLDGRPLARIERFGVKRVRSLDGIQRLLNSGHSARLHAVPAPAAPAPEPVAAPAANASGVAGTAAAGDALLGLIGELVAAGAGRPWHAGDAAKSFFDLGLDSLALLDMAEALEARLSVRLYPTLLFECPSPAQLATYLGTTFEKEVAAALGATQPAAAVANAAAAADATAGPIAAVSSEPPPAPPVTPRAATPTTRDAREPVTLVPRWVPIADDAAPPTPTPPGAIALLGSHAAHALQSHLAARWGEAVRLVSTPGSGAAEPAEVLRAALRSGQRFDSVCLLDLDHDAAFAVIQALLEGDALPPDGMALRAVSFDAFGVHGQAPRSDAAHGVWGLLQSLSREHPSIRVSQLDLARAELDRLLQADTTLAAALAPSRDGQRELRALRSGRLYRRELFDVRTTEAAAEPSGFRPGGVYVVIGGAGGVGMAFVRWLRARYGARVVVVGRRELDETLRSRLLTAGRLDDEIVYAQAAVEDSAALRRVLQAVRARFGALHGVVHSAMVLDDRRLHEMDAASLARVLAPKVDGVRALAAATAGFDLECLLFFSSMQSYLGNAAQANYAAASTYLDGYAASLRAERAYPVQVVNWGFWGEVGAVATPVYRQLLARQGVHGLEATPAFALLERAAAAGWHDVLIASAEDEVLREMGWSGAWLLERRPLPAPGERASIALDEAPLRQRAAALESARSGLDALVALAHARVAQVLADIGLSGAAASPVDAAVADGRLAREHAALAKVLVSSLANPPAQRPALSAEAFDAGVAALEQGEPALRAFAPLLQAAVGAYPDLLRGRKTAAEVLFPGGSSHLVRAVYGDSELSRHYNQVVAEAACALAQRGQRRAPVRILEIGAGTGATSVAVLDALDAAGVPCQYHYTDLWDKLVADARERLGPMYPQLRFGFLDIGAPPEAQGHSASFDIVVATNVLHATRDLHLALRHAKRLLRPGGALIVNESVEAQPYSTLTFGLLPGWWGASDAHERLAASPLAATSSWVRMLHDEGYVGVQPLVPDAACAGGQQVLVALSDGETRHPASSHARQAAPATTPPQRGLPAPLQGRLHAFALPRGPVDDQAREPLRHLQLFRDELDGHLWLFLDNPPANTFNEALLVELCTLLEALAAADALRGRLLFVSHFGEYFSLGGDRGEIVRRLEAGEHARIEHFAAKASELLQRLVGLDALVVAVVAGTAQGGGLETLFATDLQLVGETVKLGLPEVKSGLIPGMGGMSWLQGQIGTARTKRLLFLGELIDAREAHALGLISHVVADPFAAALALPRTLSHLDTALRIKRVLARDAAQQHTADIETWRQHLLHAPIDKRRIENAGLLLHAKTALASAPETRAEPTPPASARLPLQVNA